MCSNVLGLFFSIANGVQLRWTLRGLTLCLAVVGGGHLPASPGGLVSYLVLVVALGPAYRAWGGC